ncbi:MAG: hypothetical protein KL863_24185 [Rhizobium sp.]|nr:hypothetical protein [Rhizobium sp.]
MLMQQRMFDAETLMAFADGELDAAMAARVAGALDGDPSLAAEVEMYRSTRAAIAEAMQPVVREAVPPSLTLSVLAMVERDREARAQPASVVRGGVVSLDKARSRRRSKAPAWLMPMAAALVLVAGGSGGYFIGSRLPAPVPVEFASIDDPAIIQALSEIPSGNAVDVPGTGRTIEPILSFQLEDGTLCREYKLKGPEAKGVVSIACREQDRWKTHLLMASTRVEEGFEPAGSAETIDAYLASIHAGSPLDGPAEDAALGIVRR